MRRARWNWHGRAVGTLLFVVVFLAATLSGSPRNHDRRIGSQRKSVYSRTLAENDGKATNIVEDVARELEDANIAEIPREFHAEPVKIDHKVSVLQQPNATTCAVVLLNKHPELCDVVEEILAVQALLPRLRRVVERRMGGRRFNFVYEMVRGKTAFQHLYDTVKCMAVCIKKFVKFVGTVEGLILPTTTTTTTTTEDPVPDVEIEIDASHSYDWYLTSMKKEPVNPSFAAPHFNPSNSRYTRRGSPRNCVASVMKVDPDVCGTLTKMELLDSILVTPGKAIIEEDPIENSELPVELDSENLVLGTLLDAVEESLADARTKAPDVGATEEARRRWDTRDKTRSRGRRRMPNGNDEEAAEIFQTSDFKIELVPHDDHRSFGHTGESRNAKNFIVDGNKEHRGRRVFTVEDRSLGLHDQKANERGQDMTKGPLPRGAQSLLRNVATERSTSWSIHSSRSQRENSTSGNTDKGQEKTPKLLQNPRGSWESPYYPDRTIPWKTYPHYRAGDPDTEGSNDEKNKEPCEEKEAENGNWKEWLFSKVREFSKKAFGA